MELSPKAITSVDFHIVRKGYDPDEVKAFLNQLAKGVEILQTQLSNADARARAAVAKMQQAVAGPPSEPAAAPGVVAAAVAAPPAAASPAPTAATSVPSASASAPAAAPAVVSYAPQAPAADHETISRTLLLAQHTADATVHTAEERARQIVSDAEQHATKIVTEGEAKRSELVGTAEAAATAAGARERAKLEAEVLALAARRDDLHKRTQVLDTQLADHRRRLVDLAGSLHALAEGPDGLASMVAAAATSGATASGPPSGSSRPTASAPVAPVVVSTADDGEPVRSLWADDEGAAKPRASDSDTAGFFERGARFGDGRTGPAG